MILNLLDRDDFLNLHAPQHRNAVLARPVADLAWETGEFRLAAMSLMLKCADMNSVSRPPAVAGMWARAIYMEFFRQADLEAELGLPPTPVFQRDSVVIPAAQVLTPGPSV